MQLENVLSVLPPNIKKTVRDSGFMTQLEEIRLRINRPLEIKISERFVAFDIMCAKEDILYVLNAAGRHSLYAYEDDIKNGFLTMDGGHRIGFTGRVIHGGGQIMKLDSFNSLNIRIAREIKGCAETVLPLITKKGAAESCVIASAPGVGKTTLLRDLTRCISDGIGATSMKVGLIDERGEVASCTGGAPQLDVGRRTDVLDNCPKAQGMTLLIRSMSPEVIVTDEIGGSADIEAVSNASLSGIRVITTAHASDIDELLNKPQLEKIAKTGVFKRYIFIERKQNVIYARAAYDEKHEPIAICG